MNIRYALALLAPFALCSAVAQDPSSAKRVSVVDIDRTVTLIGRLGYPLGTMLAIDGTWGYPDPTHNPTKDYSLQFTIRTVNGRRLANPLILKAGYVDITDKNGASLIPPLERHKELDGDSWFLRAYETGKHTVMPVEYWRHRGSPGMIPQPAFASSIVGFMDPDGG